MSLSAVTKITDSLLIDEKSLHAYLPAIVFAYAGHEYGFATVFQIPALSVNGYFSLPAFRLPLLAWILLAIISANFAAIPDYRPRGPGSYLPPLFSLLILGLGICSLYLIYTFQLYTHGLLAVTLCFLQFTILTFQLSLAIVYDTNQIYKRICSSIRR